MHIGHELTTTYVMKDGGGLRNLDAIIVKERDLGVHVMRDLKSGKQCTCSQPGKLKQCWEWSKGISKN